MGGAASRSSSSARDLPGRLGPLPGLGGGPRLVGTDDGVWREISRETHGSGIGSLARATVVVARLSVARAWARTRRLLADGRRRMGGPNGR
jgi:hypothetical protein